MSTLAAQNRILLAKLLVIVALMGSFAFALVPLYRAICEAVGISDSRDVNYPAGNAAVDLSRSVRVEFVAASHHSMPLRFEPNEPRVEVHPGEVATVTYRVVNTTGRPLIGQAVPSFAPERAGRYFTKLECFCFNRQTFAPGQSRDLPVVFYVSRELPRDMTSIALSYTFFDVTAEARGPNDS